MRKFLDLKIKVLLRFRISADAKSLNTKISTILAQRRINGTEFFTIFKEKVTSLGIREDVSIPLRVFLCILTLEEYIIYIRLPSITHLLNHFFNTKMNYNCPGYLYKRKIQDDLFFNYIITPFILFEIIKYRYAYEHFERISIKSVYSRCVSSLKAKGINLWLPYFENAAYDLEDEVYSEEEESSHEEESTS